MYYSIMKIYQIYYNKETFSRLDEEFIPYDNKKNERTEWYEFEVIYSYLKNNSLQDNVWYGFLSPEFCKKTNLTGLQIKSHLKQNEKSNVCLATSCFDQIAIYQNCFLQGEAKHPGLIIATEYLLKKFKLNLPIKNLVGHSSNTVFSNYLIAKKEYWQKWYDLASFFMKLLKEDKIFLKIINTKSNYKNSKVNLGVFIQERFPTIILSSQNFKVTTLLSTDYKFCNQSIPLNFRSRGLIQTCDYIKEKYSRTGDKNLINLLRFNLEELKTLIKDNEKERN